MLTYFRDLVQTATLKARYRRRVQEQLLNLVEAASPQPVAPDRDNWLPVGNTRSAASPSQLDVNTIRARARDLAQNNPHARNILRLLEIYVVGPGLKLTHAPAHPAQQAASDPLIALADKLWTDFLSANQRHFSWREYARRTWRDGETFLRKFSSPIWPTPVRFVDPELIADPITGSTQQGIVTPPDDVESPLAYLRIDPHSHALLEEIPADLMQHTRVGVDSNQKRGVTILLPILDALVRFESWLDAELLARKLQASIVLWRKIQGSPSQAAAFADANQFSVAPEPGGNVRREKLRAGTILTTSQGTDLQFLQPNTNFVDAVPLGRMLLLCMAAGQGLPEFMLTSDASNGNFASTMIAEGPAVKMFQAEQQFFIAEFTRLWRWVMEDAQQLGLLPDDFFDRVTTLWHAPQLVNRDRPRERLADVRLVESRILSRAEIARRDGVDPQVMQAEINNQTAAAPA